MDKLRKFIASISEQILYYLALFLSFLVWAYSNSIYLSILTFAVLLLLAWYLSSKIEGENKNDKKN
ncbi:hypothetical protein [Nitrincola sp. MINF-07-Sa-05]|uniref:hypothetical protein n=1 Tax=Nitrincola salilacus TaxID=3400273 RepID=UPI003917E6EC